MTPPSLRGTAAPCASLPQTQDAPPAGLGFSPDSPKPDSKTEATGPPRFLGDPAMDVPCSSTPAGPLRSATTALRWCLPPFQRRRLPREPKFRGSITRPIHSLSTLRRMGYPTATQDSLPDGWPTFPGRDWLPACAQRKVSGHPILLSQASHGAPLSMSSATRRCEATVSPLGDQLPIEHGQTGQFFCLRQQFPSRTIASANEWGMMAQ